jgi:hypothetical protein
MIARSRAVRVVVAGLFLAFDLTTILPALAGGYIVKRAANIDVVPGVDMLPDELIERVMAAVARLVGQIIWAG